MDIKSLQEVHSTEFELKDPRDGRTPLGAFITVAGPEHPKRKQLAFSIQRRVRARIQKANKIELGDPEDELQALDLAVSCTLGWRGLNDGATPIEFSSEKARELYTTPGLEWIKKQVMEAMYDNSLFIKGFVKD